MERPRSHLLWRTWDRFGRTFASATPMFLLVIATEAHTVRWKPGQRVAALAIAVVLGAALYTLARGSLRVFHATIADPATFHEALIAYFSRAFLVGGLLTAIMYFAAREREATRSLYCTRVARVEIERQLVESKLELLQAQIEPHFLFNSLASVKRLYESDSGKASALLLNLAAYLREATLRVRQREIPLKDEVALARSFLAIFQVRMGRRLQVRVEVPADLDDAMIPPLTVGTLIENAVKHGIGPRASGGCVALTAHREGDVLVVQVDADGRPHRLPAKRDSEAALGDLSGGRHRFTRMTKVVTLSPP